MILSYKHRQSSSLHRKMIFLPQLNKIRAPLKTTISLTKLSIKSPRPKMKCSQTIISNRVKTMISLAAVRTITINRNLYIRSLTLKISVAGMCKYRHLHTNSSNTMISLQCLHLVVTFLRCQVLQLRHQRISRTYLTCLAIEKCLKIIKLFKNYSLCNYSLSSMTISKHALTKSTYLLSRPFQLPDLHKDFCQSIQSQFLLWYF